MGRVRMMLGRRANVLMISGRGRAHALLGAGALLITVGLWLLCGPGWAMLVAGVQLLIYAFVLVDVGDSTPVPAGAVVRPPRG